MRVIGNNSNYIYHLKIFAVFAGLSIVLRFFSFFPSVINHDESTYIVIADALLAGNIYWVDYVDTKPLGIFLLFALFKFLFGNSIFIYRVITALWLALSAYLLYRVKLKFGSPKHAGIAAGVLYLLLNSIFTFYGVSPNTETYFGLFTITALLFLLNTKWPVAFAFLSGLMLGLGFIIKYVVAFDALAFGLLLVWHFFQEPGKRVQRFKQAIVMVIGFTFPLLAVWSYFSAIDQQELFLFYTFEVSSRYPVSATLEGYLVFVLDFFGRFLPVTLFFIYVLVHKQTNKINKYFGLLWSVLVLGIILLPGKFFGHYFIHFMLPFCFVAGEFFGFQKEQLPKWIARWFQPKVAYIFLALVIFANLFLQKNDYFDKPDYPRQIAKYIAPKLKSNDEIYTGNYSQIIYHLLNRQSPIRYIHPSLFWEEKHIKALEINREQEIARLKAIYPKYFIVQDSLKSGEINDYLKSSYQPVQQFGKRIVVFERVE